MTNTIIISYFRSLLENTNGNYFELGSNGGELVSVLSQDFANKSFITVDSAAENYNSTINNVFDHANVLFYAMSAEEFNRTLTDAVAITHNVTVVYINHGVDYVDYAESIKVAQRLIATKPGYVVINQANATPDIIAEFQNLLGYRIVKETPVIDAVVSYQIREQ